MPKTFICALPTPFDGQNRIDTDSYIKLIERVQPYADGLLALGTTAEAQLLNADEKTDLLNVTRQVCPLPLIAGIEQASTAAAAKEAEHYAKLGADMLLIAPPPFCKCTVKGYICHIEEIIKASGLPVMLYNIPSRAGYGLDIEAIAELAYSHGVRYIKDSCNNVDFAKKVRPYADVLCGSDEMLDEYLDCGASGAVSVAGNYAPKHTRQVLDCGTAEEKTEFKKLAKLAASEVNPIAIKYMLYKAGVFTTYSVRLPLTPANRQTRDTIDGALGI